MLNPLDKELQMPKLDKKCGSIHKQQVKSMKAAYFLLLL